MTEAKNKGGRPPMPESARATWQSKVRLTPAEGIAAESAAATAGLTVAEWIRAVILAKLRRR